MRVHFTQQLDELNKLLIEMGALTEEAIDNAIKALNDHDVDLAKKTIKGDGQINHYSRVIESKCLDLVLQQQPVASDFRFISSALKMVYDIERIGDMAADISEIVVYISKKKYTVSNQIKQMAAETKKMVHDSIDAYVNKDVEAARAVIAYDDIVDDLLLDIKKELTKEIKKETEGVSQVLDKLMIAKYFERIGDHAVNIGEWVEYAVTGIYKGDY
ncbi:MAG: phosphate signaling complex protein PhoU [Christensenellaceae bacterium]|nr:phosphate signaling complex protein PhoU [Christensenellaceae bacterium]